MDLTHTILLMKQICNGSFTFEIKYICENTDVKRLFCFELNNKTWMMQAEEFSELLNSLASHFKFLLPDADVEKDERLEELEFVKNGGKIFTLERV